MNSYQTFKWIKAVIISCENFYQLETSCKLVDNFEKMFNNETNLIKKLTEFVYFKLSNLTYE